MTKYLYAAVKYNCNYQSNSKDALDDTWDIYTIIEEKDKSIWTWMIFRKAIDD